VNPTSAERRQFLLALAVATSLHALALAVLPAPKPEPERARPVMLRFDVEAVAPSDATAAGRDAPVPGAEASVATTASSGPPPAQAPPDTARAATETAVVGGRGAVDDVTPSPLASSTESTVRSAAAKRLASIEPRRSATRAVTGDHSSRNAADVAPRAVGDTSPAPGSAPSRRREVVGGVAPSRVASVPADGAARTAERLRASYEQVLAAWLARHKYYPAVARRRGLEGAGVVRVRIDRRGHVQSGTIERDIGSDVLDHAALDMVRRSDPFPPMPDRLAGDHFEFVVPIEYRQID
jgi:protein TonB